MQFMFHKLHSWVAAFMGNGTLGTAQRGTNTKIWKGGPKCVGVLPLVTGAQVCRPHALPLFLLLLSHAEQHPTFMPHSS